MTKLSHQQVPVPVDSADVASKTWVQNLGIQTSAGDYLNATLSVVMNNLQTPGNIDFDTVEKIIGHETYLRAKARSRIAFWEGRHDEVAQSYLPQDYPGPDTGGWVGDLGYTDPGYGGSHQPLIDPGFTVDPLGF